MDLNYERSLKEGSCEVLHGSETTVDVVEDPSETDHSDDADLLEELSAEEYDYSEIIKIGKLNGKFKLDDIEEELFEGDYEIKFIENKLHASIDPWIMDGNIPLQLIFRRGRVLYKPILEDGENIFDLIEVFIRYTHDPCTDLNLDKSGQMLLDTICPTKKILFVYKNREFIAYGRYFFGYCRQYVKIKNETNCIKLPNPPFYDDCYDYVYSFMIRNHTSNVIEAFGLYR